MTDLEKRIKALADGWNRRAAGSIIYEEAAVYQECAADVLALLSSAPSADAGTETPHKHEFAYYEVCKVCGRTDAAISGCHHCNDGESVKNGRCWWCLLPVSAPPAGTDPHQESYTRPSCGSPSSHQPSPDSPSSDGGASPA